MIDLGNELEKDIWLNIPHLADDAFVRAMAEAVRDSLDPALKVYVEFSNEVWNSQFSQSRLQQIRCFFASDLRALPRSITEPTFPSSRSSDSEVDHKLVASWAAKACIPSMWSPWTNCDAITCTSTP